MKYDKLFDSLKSYNCLGEKKLDDNTILIGMAPHIAPEAWLHCIYPGLNKLELEELENELTVKIPIDYRFFLGEANGLGIFNTTLSLFGKRKNYIRTAESIWQPFSLLRYNVDEKPDNAGDNIFFIGSYDWDGSLLYIDTNTSKVHLTSREFVSTEYEWPSFYDMLNTEINRLKKLFDSKGVIIDEERSTLPID